MSQNQNANGGSNNEISITLVNVDDGAGSRTESLSVSKSQTTLQDLASLACALFGIEGAPNGSDASKSVQLLKDGKVIFHPSLSSAGQRPLSTVAGLSDGDMIAVLSVASDVNPAPQNSAAPSAGLDFSSLLSSSSATATAAPVAISQTQGLTFSLPGLNSVDTRQQPVVWDGMHLDDVMERNSNPDHIIQVLFNTTRHPHLLKELNYHNPQLVTKLKQVYYGGGTEANAKEAARVWRSEIFKGTISSTLSRNESQTKDSEMARRLQQNPTDAEAKEFFDKKKKQQAVNDQYRQMMEEYPEAMGRVLMLYIEADVNGHAIQAFVDSGAQSTIMSKACAEKCELLDLIDTRFEGMAVGVGTGKILGRIHIAQLKIHNHYFPCSITVMDSDGKGLGDKNMEFLLGLDMLKRHRCKIDLEINSLVFGNTNDKGESLMAPFLHEKDLSVGKGGTQGFDATASNIELERAIRDGGGDEKEKKSTEQNKDGTDMEE